MIVTDTNVNEMEISSFNWKLIDKSKFPQRFNDDNAPEDFELLFQENFDNQKLKEIFRTTVREPNQAVRKYLWKRILLTETTQTENVKEYNKKCSVLFGKNLTLKHQIPDFCDHDHTSCFFLNEDGKMAMSRILNVIASVHPDITYAPLLLPLASLFLHYMIEAEAYACLISIIETSIDINSPVPHQRSQIAQTDICWTTKNRVFQRLADRFSHDAHQYLLESVYNSTNDTDATLQVIEDWKWWIFEYLPFDYVLNIVDSFLIEGQKVLYR
jgi:hypothetical protein